MRFRAESMWIIAVLWFICSASLAPGQAASPAPPGGTATPAPVTAPTIAERRAAVQTELEDVRRRLGALPVDVPSEARARLEKELEILERHDRALTQLESAEARVQELTSSKAEMTVELDRLRTSGPSEPPPYSVLLLDDLRDRLEAEQARTDSLAAAVAATSSAVVDADQALRQREVERRRAREAEATNTDEARRAELAAAHRFAQLESRVAEEMAALRKVELMRESLAKDLHDLKLQALELRIDWVSRSTRFTRADLEEKLLEIETARSRVRQRLQTAEATLVYLEPDWIEAKRRLDASTEPDPVLTEEVVARRLAIDAARETIEASNKRLERLAAAETSWKRRFDLRLPASATALSDWEQEATSKLEALNIEERLLMTRASEFRTRLGTLAERIESLDASDAALGRWLIAQRTHLRTMTESIDARLQSIDSARRLYTRFLTAIGVEAEGASFSQRVAAFRQAVADAWDFEVWTVDERPITVGKIVIGLLILLFGLFASRLFSRLVGRRVLPRFKLNEGASAAIQSILFYLLVITFTLLAFRAVNIPLTAFTVLGGALAIGVGFGSQNVIANFISGLILIAERPVRVGDLVDVNGLYGTVEHIGARSTRVRTGDNIEIIVPNSAFLEKNVINWTLSDDKIRTKVTVGVAYGSPTREVTKLIARAVEEHGRVHKKPHPIVLFVDFGDNALIFEVHFWLTMKRLMDRRMIESDVRHRIDSLFRDAGIVIAFPQRDVHWHAAAPIDIRLVDHEAGGRSDHDAPALSTAGHA